MWHTNLTCDLGGLFTVSQLTYCSMKCLVFSCKLEILKFSLDGLCPEEVFMGGRNSTQVFITTGESLPYNYYFEFHALGFMMSAQMHKCVVFHLLV